MQTKPKYRLEIIPHEVTWRRLSNAWSRSDLARIAGISESRINKIEGGFGGGVGPKTVQKLCDALDCRPEDISEVQEATA